MPGKPEEGLRCWRRRFGAAQVRNGQSRPEVRTRGPGLCTRAAAFKDPCVRARARRPARGAGGGAALRPGLTCPRSQLPFPVAARAGGCSCRASERLVSVVARRTNACTTITRDWTRLPAELGQRLAFKLLPQASSHPSPPSPDPPSSRGTSVSSKPNPTPRGRHVTQAAQSCLLPSRWFCSPLGLSGRVEDKKGGMRRALLT